MASDRRVTPELATRAWDTFIVQGTCDCARADAGGEFAENAPDNTGLGFVDLPVAANGITAGIELFDDIVAEAEPAT
ncbi:hypothetical protein ACLBWS_08910 [Brucellaceae bacterium D45D]